MQLFIATTVNEGHIFDWRFVEDNDLSEEEFEDFRDSHMRDEGVSVSIIDVEELQDLLRENVKSNPVYWNR